MPRIIVCKDCGEEKEHKAHGLCKRCYARHYYHESREIRAERLRRWEEKRRGTAGGYKNLAPDRKEVANFYRVRRRAYIESVPNTLTRAEEQQIRSMGRCFYCEEPVAPNRIHLDHFVPLSKKGGTTRANLVASCASCNHSKRTKLPAQILKQLPLHLSHTS